jgi:hypothetical protein
MPTSLLANLIAPAKSGALAARPFGGSRQATISLRGAAFASA